MKLSDDMVISGKKAMGRSYAKINLTLDVVGKRPDGYHSIETIMQTVNLSDIIIVEKYGNDIKITSNKKFLPLNNKNTAYSEDELFFNKMHKNSL